MSFVKWQRQNPIALRGAEHTTPAQYAQSAYQAAKRDERTRALHVIDTQRAAFISDEAFAQVRGEIEQAQG